MNDVIIRLARPEELKIVQDLNHELFISDNEHLHDLNVDWPYEPDGEAYFTSLIAGERGVVYVAEQGTAIVGYVAGAVQKPHSGYTGRRAELENMFVSPERRSMGIGAKLVEAFYAWCRQQSVDYVMVTAFSPNTRAIAFYKKQGFEPYSTTLWAKT